MVLGNMPLVRINISECLAKGAMKQMKKSVYVKPVIEKIELAVEEAILGDCKLQNGAGPNQDLCMNTGNRTSDTPACRGASKS